MSSQSQGKVGVPYPKRKWAKQLYKSPILLWRLGFAPVIGQIFMILTTTGRKSKQPRRAVVEYRTTEDGRKYVFSAFGEDAHWYKNILADPYVTVQTADGIEPSRARRVMDDQEMAMVFQLYQKNPILRGWMANIGLALNEHSFVANKNLFHVVTFDPTDEPTPMMLEQDLKWVVPTVVTTLGAMRQIRRELGRGRTKRNNDNEELT